MSCLTRISMFGCGPWANKIGTIMMQGRAWKPHQQCDLGWVLWVTQLDPLRIWKQISHVDGQPPPQDRALIRSLDIKTEKAMASHSSTLAWKLPWTEKPGKLQSMGLLKVRHGTRRSDFTFAFHFPALEKEIATHSSVLAWRIPGTGEPGGLPSVTEAT